MIIIEKTIIKNIVPYVDETIIWNKYDKVLITGINKMNGMSRNAVGKSMLADMLTWSLWGKTYRELDKQTLKIFPNKKAIVKTFFNRDGVKYCVERILKRNGSVSVKITRYINDEIDQNFKTGKTNKITQEIINDILETSYISFISTSYYGQDNINKFLSGQPKERESIITTFFSLNKWDAYKIRAKNEMSSMMMKRSLLSEKLSFYKDLIKGIDVEKVIQEKKKARQLSLKHKKEVELKEKQYEQVREYERIRITLEKNITTLKTIEDIYQQTSKNMVREIEKTEYKLKSIDIKNLKRKVNNEVVLEEQYEIEDGNQENLQSKIKELEKKQHYYENSAKTCLSNIREWEDMISHDDMTCPTCGQKIHKEYEEFINEKITKNKGHLNDWKRRTISVKKQIKRYNDMLERIIVKKQKIQVKINEIHMLKSKQTEYYRDKKYLADIKKSLQSQESENVRKHKIYQALIEQGEMELDKIAKMLNLDRKEINADTLNEELSEHYTKFNEYDGIYKEKKLILSQFRSYKRNLGVFEKKQKKIEYKIELYEYLVKAYTAIKLYIIDVVNQTLQNKTNETLSLMGIDTRIKFDIEYDRKSSDGKILKYNIMLSSSGKDSERSWKSYSGGEKKRITLAVYYSFQMTAEKFSKQMINLVIFDEVFGGLDVAGKDMMVKLINRYKQKNIHVITHHEDVMALFKNKMVIVRSSDGCSKIQKS